MRVLITGASSGIGEAAARRFHKEGHTPILVARRESRLKALSQELGGCPYHVADVGVIEEIQSVVEKEEKRGPIEVLINSAGFALGLGPFQEGDREDWEQMVQVNILGLLYATRAVLPYFVRRNRGHILNLGSIAAHYPYPGGNVYGATKAFVHQFSLNLRADLHGTKVRVTCMEPGLCETEFSLVRFKGDQEKAKEVYAHAQPLLPEDIAELLFVAATLPERVNINTLEVMPTSQSFSRLPVHRS